MYKRQADDEADENGVEDGAAAADADADDEEVVDVLFVGVEAVDDFFARIGWG